MKYEWQIDAEKWTRTETLFLIGAIMAGNTYTEAQRLLNKKFGTKRSRCSIAGKVHRLKYKETAPKPKPVYVGLMA